MCYAQRQVLSIQTPVLKGLTVYQKVTEVNYYDNYDIHISQNLLYK